MAHPPPGNHPTLHHAGFVVPAIAPVAQRFGLAGGLVWDGAIHHDPIQRVRVAFLWSAGAAAPTPPALELVEPAGDDSPVARILQAAGGGLHHLCFEVDRLEDHLAWCRSHRIMPVVAPAPAVAFGGRRIAWVYTPERLLIEFLEREPAGESAAAPTHPTPGTDPA